MPKDVPFGTYLVDMNDVDQAFRETGLSEDQKFQSLSAAMLGKLPLKTYLTVRGSKGTGPIGGILQAVGQTKTGATVLLGLGTVGTVSSGLGTINSAREAYNADSGWKSLYYGLDTYDQALDTVNGLSALRQGAKGFRQQFAKSRTPTPVKPKTNIARANDQLTIIDDIKCFAPDTLVATPQGPRAIGEMRSGDEVLAFNHGTGQWVVDRVAKWHENFYEGPLVTITTDGGTVRTTVYHPFWVASGRDLDERSAPRELELHEDEGLSLPGRWVNSHELRPGDILISQDGGQRTVLRIEQHYEPNFGVCNLTISDGHTFAVGPDALLVHNTGNCDPDYDALVEAAKNKYPKKANLPDESHHIDPKYLGGDPNGPTVPLNPAYHQEITNAFRNEKAYGTVKRALSPEELQRVKNIVYGEFPLPPGTEF